MDRYMVFIDNHVFYMSRYPDRANEVNTYGGELKLSEKKRDKFMKTLKFVKLLAIPTVLKYAIRQRVQQIRGGE